jgi:hypothetical protein
MSELSGVAWCSRFPGSSSTADLTAAFKNAAELFIGALRTAGATVAVTATYRPPERAYLMHHAWRISKQDVDPTTVPSMAGVDINWVHVDAMGVPDRAKSKAAALAMVNGYGMVFIAALTSRHTEKRAVDMTISWAGTLKIKNKNGETVSISTTPRDGMNTDLHAVGATYGVVKLLSDPPHWSDDGH